MRPELYQQIAMSLDVPEVQLKRGDLAMLVDYVPHPHGGEEGAVLEIFNVLGESIRVATVPVSAIEALRPDQMPSVRPLELQS
ncbi:MAG: DUF4926 domain-containing protein [Aggregatilineales bacterium]